MEKGLKGSIVQGVESLLSDDLNEWNYLEQFELFLVRGLSRSRQLLQSAPVFQSIFLRPQQDLGGLTRLVELLGKPPLAAGEIDEGERLVALGRRPPIFFLSGITDQA